MIIAGALLATGAHALRRAARRSGASLPRGAVAGVLFAAALLPPSPAAAEKPNPQNNLTKLPLDDNDPESTVPTPETQNKDPLEFGYWLQDVTMKAEVYAKHQDHAAAIKYYRALARAVPDRAIAFERVCEQYEAIGDRDKATAACGSALLVNGVTVGDYAHYVRLVLAKPGRLSRKEQDRLAEVLDSMKGGPIARDAASELECEVGARTSNVQQLTECTAALAAKASPNDDLKLLGFEWSLAMAQGNLAQARLLVDQAKKAGETNERVQVMERAIATASRRHMWSLILTALAAVLLAAGLGLIARHILRKRVESQGAPELASSPSS
jgi:hypothetical protein